MILVVESSLELARSVCEQIEGACPNLASLRTGEDALKFCRKTQPSLILLAAEMPNMDGFETLELLKADLSSSGIPVILLAKRHDPEAEARAFRLGAADFMARPFSTAALLARIETLLTLAKYRAHLEESLRQAEDNIVASFAALLENRDATSAGHAHRTSIYMGILGLRLMERGKFKESLTAETLKLMVRAAPLHDIGKASLPDAVLLKSTPYSASDREAMKKHVQIGADALSAMLSQTPAQTYLRYAVQVAGSHHEHFDGTGYPQGLAGEAIPVSARIMAVADVYDALTSSRTWRPAMPHEQARQLVVEGKGTLFDPLVVEAFLDIEDIFGNIVEIEKQRVARVK
jgi:putative two-component system response regulator